MNGSILNFFTSGERKFEELKKKVLKEKDEKTPRATKIDLFFGEN